MTILCNCLGLLLLLPNKLVLVTCELRIHQPNPTIFKRVNGTANEYLVDYKEAASKYGHLICEGPVLMKWRISGYQHQHLDTKTSLSYSNEGYQATLFFVIFSDVDDNGFYTCEALEDKHRLDNPAASIYIYILGHRLWHGKLMKRSKWYFKIEDRSEFKHINDSKSCVRLLIPCQVSAPHAEVTLFVDMLGDKSMLVSNAKYDPKVGFSLRACYRIEDIFKFFCKSGLETDEYGWEPLSRNNLNERDVHLFPFPSFDFRLSCAGDKTIMFHGGGINESKVSVVVNLPINSVFPYSANLQLTAEEKDLRRRVMCNDSKTTTRFVLNTDHAGPSFKKNWDYYSWAKTYTCFNGDESLQLTEIYCINLPDCEQKQECHTNSNCQSPMDQAHSCFNPTSYYSSQSLGRVALTVRNPSGLFYCRNNLGYHMNKFFTGIDGILYFLDHDTIPESALININLTNNTFFLGIHTEMKVVVKFSTYLLADWVVLFIKRKQGIVSERDDEYLTEKVITDTNYSTHPKPKERDHVIFRTYEWKLSPETGMSELIYSVPMLSKTGWRNFSVFLDVQDAVEPKITNIELDFVFYLVDSGSHEIKCIVEGNPAPDVFWRKLTPEFNNSEYAIQEQMLIFPSVVPEIAGFYLCVAFCEMRNISDSKIFSVKVEEKPFDWEALIWLLVSIPVFIAVILCLCLYFIKREKVIVETVKKLTDQEVEDFFNGTSPSCRPHFGEQVDAAENAVRMPYNEVFEIDTKDIVYETQNLIGKGAFGLVFKAIRKPGNKPVAVKCVQENVNIEVFKLTLSELKILMFVGYHPNIVEFLGAITKEIEKLEVKLILEYCEIGDMQSYLRKNFNMKDIADAKNETQKPPIQLFLKWLIGITFGMEHLAKRKIIHGDLATRNILLDRNLDPKITDFGLSSRSADYTSYVKKGTSERLPWRWMAIECLTRFSFSSASDVWAFGVTAWEIFSFGETPYPNCTWDQTFIHNLGQGTRLPKPENCPDEIFTELLSCWDENVQRRSNASLLKEQFQEISLTIPSA